jgi:hypothetical protein
VRFAVEGTDHEIHLGAKNVAAFRKLLAPQIEHARRAEWARARPGARTAASRQPSRDIRAWGETAGPGGE